MLSTPLMSEHVIHPSIGKVGWGLIILIFSTTQALTADNGKFNIKGRAVLDINDLSGTPAGVNVPDLRIKPIFKINSTLSIGGSIDFAESDVEILTLAARIKGLVNFSIGQSKVPIGLEITSSSLHTSFVDRPLFNDLVDGVERQTGVLASWQYGRLKSLTGVFYEAIDDNQDLNQFTISNRSIFSFTDASGHIGLSYRYRNRTDNQALNRQTRSAFTDGQLFSDPVNAQDHTILIDGLWQTGPLTLSAEAGLNKNRGSSSHGVQTTLSWYIGGKRGYRHKDGRFVASDVNHSVFEGGSGAVELTFRSDYSSTENNLSDRENTFEQRLGVNWHLSKSSRLLTNFSILHTTRGAASQTARSIQLRLQFFL